MLRHSVEFYDPDATALVENVARSICDSLKRGDVALVVAQAERLYAIQLRLEGLNVVCRDAVKRGRLEWLDGHDVLEQIMFAGRPDPEAFDRVVGETVRHLLGRRDARAIYGYGEMVGILWNQDNEAGAVELERLWNGLLAEIPAVLHCGYPIDRFKHTLWSDTMEAVLAAHTHSIPERLVASG